MSLRAHELLDGEVRIYEAKYAPSQRRASNDSYRGHATSTRRGAIVDATPWTKTQRQHNLHAATGQLGPSRSLEG